MPTRRYGAENMMRVLSLVVLLTLVGGCTGGTTKADTGTNVDTLDRTTPVDATKQKDVGRDTADTGTRKTYPSGG